MATLGKNPISGRKKSTSNFETSELAHTTSNHVEKPVTDERSK